MKKTLLAAALLAGFASIAHAETQVTLYGIVDTGIGYNKFDGVAAPGGEHFNHSRVGMVNGVQSGSRFGLRGSEDLGDGLRAIFNLEAGFDSSNGNSAQGGRLFGRIATMGLASNSWGQLEFGRQTTMSSKYFGTYIDPFGAGFAQANLGNSFSAANTNRYDNLVLYQTPVVGGFQAGVGYSFNVNASTNQGSGDNSNFQTADNVRGITAGVRYGNGPLNVVLSYDQLNQASGSKMGANNYGASYDATPRMYAIGAGYDFEVVKVTLGYARTENGWFAGQGMGVPGASSSWSTPSYAFADDFKANSYAVGLTVPVGATTAILGSWQMIDPKNDKLTGGDSTNNIFSLGLTYNFSKRTNLYAYGSYSKNTLFIDDNKSTSVGVGLRHLF